MYNQKIGNADIYLNKNLMWDIDAEGEPMKAVYQGEKVYGHVKGLGYEPMMVFSGSKGLRILLTDKNRRR